MFNQDRFKRAVLAAIYGEDMLSWREIADLAVNNYNFPKDGNYLQIRGVIQELINENAIERTNDVRNENYTIVRTEQ